MAKDLSAATSALKPIVKDGKERLSTMRLVSPNLENMSRLHRSIRANMDCVVKLYGFIDYKDFLTSLINATSIRYTYYKSGVLL